MRIVVKNLPQSSTREELEELFGKQGTVTDVYMLENSRGMFRRVCFIGYKTEEEAIRAQKYFDNNMFKNHKISVELAQEEIEEMVRQAESKERRILYSRTIFIRGLSVNVEMGSLKEELEKEGKVMEIRIEKKEERACAIVKFREGTQAVNVFKKIKTLMGMRVKIGPYNETHAERRKTYYNSLFFNFDTVIKRTCEMEKVGKRDLVDIKDSKLGSRVALLETGLVAQTKVFLEHNNIYMDYITEERNKRVLVMRNTDILGVLDLMEGDYDVKMAPSKCLALIEFTEEKDALATFKKLNMRRHNNQIIYCEFAPVCNVPEDIIAQRKEKEAKKKKEEKNKTNKLVVKNVPFQATVEDLRTIFASYSHVVDVRLPIKSDKTHRGFGFVVLDSPASVERALSYFGTSTHLFGRRLVLEAAKQ